MFNTRMAAVGRYTGSIPEDTILQAITLQCPDLRDEIMQDVKAITPEQLVALAQKKKMGGFMMNRKNVIKQYNDTLEDPGYHESVMLVMALRAVPLDDNSVILSLDKISTKDF